MWIDERVQQTVARARPGYFSKPEERPYDTLAGFTADVDLVIANAMKCVCTRPPPPACRPFVRVWPRDRPHRHAARRVPPRVIVARVIVAHALPRAWRATARARERPARAHVGCPARRDARACGRVVLADVWEEEPCERRAALFCSPPCARYNDATAPVYMYAVELKRDFQAAVHPVAAKLGVPDPYDVFS